MPFSTSPVNTAGIGLNSSKMTSPEIARAANRPFTIIEKIMGAANGVHRLHLIPEISARNSNGQKTVFMGTELHEYRKCDQMREHNLFIACEIFKHELNHVLSPDKDIEIHWMDAALHATPDRMKASLEKAVADHVGSPSNHVCFLFGTGCHPDICKITKGCGSQALPVSNCIQAFLGPEETKRLEANRTMIVTPGWITAWQSIMDGLGWDEVDVRINLGRYDRILLLDAGIAPLADEDILSFYDLAQVPIEIEPVDLTYFKGLIDQVLDARQS